MFNNWGTTVIYSNFIVYNLYNSITAQLTAKTAFSLLRVILLWEWNENEKWFEYSTSHFPTKQSAAGIAVEHSHSTNY